jgi:hypothetical protein
MAKCTSPSPSGLPRVSFPLLPSSVVVLPEPAGCSELKHGSLTCYLMYLITVWMVLQCIV